MAAYVILDLDVTDLDAYREYGRLAGPSVVRYGGKLLVGEAEPEALEGKWQPRALAMIEFASAERAKAWWGSEEYRQARLLRQRAAQTNLIVVDGIEPHV